MEKEEYEVVVNGEEQYSIWLVGQAIPVGWRTVGVSGNKPHCLDWIEQHWTDMRPLSVRRRLAEAEPS